MKRWLFGLCVALWIAVGSVVAAQDNAKVFVLVHGAFQDETGWSAVVNALESAGHTAVTVNLAGRGDDATPLNEITLATYRDQIIGVIEEQSGSVVLVGHSFGGINISMVAEAVPDRIETLVYLAAYLPVNGDSLVTLASEDHYSTLGQEGNFIIAEDFSTGSVNADVFASAFCPDCTPEQAEVVAASQLSEPLAPLNEPVTLSDTASSVRSVYIMTAEDIVVSPQLQAFMLSRRPVDQVFALNTGHAAYISQPEALAELLIQSSMA
ncbi:MAG: alpha/beta fold hydrolase [Chloroflexota bacterium]|nr:alpha/beta fold hydrolase [Chloroflexota bacterium]